MAINDFYPRNPAGVPTDFTVPKKGFYLRGFFVLSGILLFILVYFTLTFFSACLFYYLAIDGIPVLNGITFILKIGSMAFAAMLFVFLFKGLILMRSVDLNDLTEIKEKDQPLLFEFIAQICRDTNNPLPGKVFVSADINASVFYNGTFQSLFWPVKKNLVIGLGLVNCINLSEFKAILAHEFGHFSQKSMRFNSYIYVANQIIFDMVYKRDKWDDFLANWAKMDIRVSFFAWILIGFTRAIRSIFAAIYKGINLLNAALSREMEFHADLVSVSLTGSDALINALAKLDHATLAFQEAASNLRDASQNHLYSNDVFFHHKINIDTLQKKIESETGSKTEIRDSIIWHFKREETRVADMYASHPSNYLREQNAKKVYVHMPEDSRSPWELFRQKRELAENMTRAFYRNYLNDKSFLTLSPADTVHQFIAEEINESTINEKYKGYYDGHFILVDETIAIGPHSFFNSKAGLEDYLFGKETEDKIKFFAAEWKDVEVVILALSAEPDAKNVKINGTEFHRDIAMEMLEARNKKYQEAREEWTRSIDSKIFYNYLFMAARLGADEEGALRANYAFLKKLQIMYNVITVNKNKVVEIVNTVMEKGQIEAEEAASYSRKLNEVYRSFNEVMDQEKLTPIPDFKRMDGFNNLYNFLMDGKEFNNSVQKLNAEWVNACLALTEDVLRRLERLYHKNLASILAMQEAIGDAYFSMIEKQ